MLTLLVLILLILLLAGGLPTYRYWGDSTGPAGLIVLIVLIVVLLAVAGYINL